MRKKLAKEIKELLENKSFREYLNNGNAVDACSFASGYLKEPLPEVSKLLETIVKASLRIDYL